MDEKYMKMFYVGTLFLLTTLGTGLRAEQHEVHNFTDVVKLVSKSTIAIAVDAPIKHSSPRVLGTGFVVADGHFAITNYHVVSEDLDPTIVENYVALSGQGSVVKKIRAEVVKIDPKHDLALLKLDSPLNALELGSEELLLPGSEVALTGFPIGAILGLYPATHRGYISAITPDAIPASNSNQLTIEMMNRLQNVSLIYQLDAIAYPGNSGSPLYSPTTGEVIGVINKVLVKDTKESALSSPTGISYAIPVKFVIKLLESNSGKD
ncbi:serine protease [Alteromonas macleodii]|uniref:S1 family peptidase n=1 Tax=Alteromonas macleodii TaxID=28108 RepID=UPI0029825ED6|nr:serine protease [Alteromonas macleodii]MDW5285639.1 serine protease [Alteromonas macleodii]